MPNSCKKHGKGKKNKRKNKPKNNSSASTAHPADVRAGNGAKGNGEVRKGGGDKMNAKSTDQLGPVSSATPTIEAENSSIASVWIRESSLTSADNILTSTHRSEVVAVNKNDAVINSTEMNSAASSSGSTDHACPIHIMVNAEPENSSKASSAEEEKLKDIAEIGKLTVVADEQADYDQDFASLQSPPVVERRSSIWNCCGLLDIFGAFWR